MNIVLEAKKNKRNIPYRVKSKIFQFRTITARCCKGVTIWVPPASSLLESTGCLKHWKHEVFFCVRIITRPEHTGGREVSQLSQNYDMLVRAEVREGACYNKKLVIFQFEGILLFTKK